MLRNKSYLLVKIVNKILIIEDDSAVAEVIRRMCDIAGITPRDFQIVNDLHEGVRLAMEQAPDLILLDLVFPPDTVENDGIEMGVVPLSKIAPVVVITGSPTSDIVVRCHDAGAQACLLKQHVMKGTCGVELLAQVVIQSTLNWKREHATGRR